MSVTTGSPDLSRTSARTVNPASRPGPRNDVREVLFALSYEALKIRGTPQRLAMSRSLIAVSTACWVLSMTQGPAIKTNGRPVPTESDPIWTGFTSLSYRLGRQASRSYE